MTADERIQKKLREGSFRTISKPSDLGRDAVGYNADLREPGDKSNSELARERAATKQAPRRGLASLQRGDRVHHPSKGNGTVHYVGSAPGMRGKPMASIVWDGPNGLAGPDPIFHGRGIARGLRKLKEGEEGFAGASRREEYTPPSAEQQKSVRAHIGKFEAHLEKLVGGRHVMAAASGPAGHPWLPHAHMSHGQGKDPETAAREYHVSTKPFWDRSKVKGDKLKAGWDRRDAKLAAKVASRSYGE